MKLEFTIPIRTVSEANLSNEHWTKKSKRHKLQQFWVRMYCRTLRTEVTLPCKITLTRIAPRSLDFDNLVSSMKWIRDQLADFLIKGKAKGQADGDTRIEWNYMQNKGVPKEYAVKIEIIY